MTTTKIKSLWAKVIGAMFALAMVLAVSVSLTACGDPTDKLTSADYQTAIDDLPASWKSSNRFVTAESSGERDVKVSNSAVDVNPDKYLEEIKGYIASNTTIQTDPKAKELAQTFLEKLTNFDGVISTASEEFTYYNLFETHRILSGYGEGDAGKSLRGEQMSNFSYLSSQINESIEYLNKSGDLSLPGSFYSCLNPKYLNTSQIEFEARSGGQGFGAERFKDTKTDLQKSFYSNFEPKYEAYRKQCEAIRDEYEDFTVYGRGYEPAKQDEIKAKLNENNTVEMKKIIIDYWGEVLKLVDDASTKENALDPAYTALEDYLKEQRDEKAKSK